MPIYEYQCVACGCTVEKWQKLSENPLTVCPQCGGSLSKLISTCAFHLKGSGWYVTDYAGKSQASDAAPKAEEAAGTPDSGSNGSPAANGNTAGDKPNASPSPKSK
jgi:putative FmdB family regulatory protein